MSIFGLHALYLTQKPCLPLHLLQPWQTQFLCGSSDFSMLTFIARWPKNWSIPEYNICFVSVYEYINKPKCFALHKFMFPYSLAPFFNSRFRTAFDRMSGSEPAMFAILSYALSLILTVLYMRHNMHEFTNSDKLMPLLFSYAYQYHQGGTVISAFDFSFNENCIFNCWITFILYSRSSHLNLTQSRHSKLFTVFSSLQTDPFMHCTIQIVSFCWAGHATNL